MAEMAGGTMPAIRLRRIGELGIDEVPVPIAGDGEAVVRVTAAGVCRTDWHLWKGDWSWEGVTLDLPWTIGHEMAGVVTEVGPGVERVRVGERVTVPFHIACGHCAPCRRGDSHVCANGDYMGSTIAGAFAPFIAIPRADLNVIPLPDWLSDDAAAAMGCRYMTAFHAATLQGRVGPGDRVAVFGAAGGLGSSAVQVVRALGALPIAVDVGAERLVLAEAAGAVATVDAAHGDVAERVVELSDGGVDVAIDALGTSATLLPAARSLRTKGRLVMAGLTSAEDAGTVGLPVDLFVLRELELVGSAGNPHHRYDALFRLIRSSGAEPERLIGRRIALADVPATIEAMGEYGTIGLTVATPA